MSWNLAGLYADVVVNPTTGGVVRSTPVNVYLPGTTTSATLYTASDKITTGTNPKSTDTFGNLVFFADPGSYDLVLGSTRLAVMVAPHPDDLNTQLSQFPDKADLDGSGVLPLDELPEHQHGGTAVAEHTHTGVYGQEVVAYWDTNGTSWPIRPHSDPTRKVVWDSAHDVNATEPPIGGSGALANDKWERRYA